MVCNFQNTYKSLNKYYFLVNTMTNKDENIEETEENNERSSNDQRSDVMNSNNPEHDDAVDNRANQLNPNNPAYHSSRKN